MKGSLVIDYEAEMTSTNGQVYTATTAPVILNTGAAGYGSQNNSAASVSHAADGYINVACGNRGKQDTAVDDGGNTYYTGDVCSPPPTILIFTITRLKLVLWVCIKMRMGHIPPKSPLTARTMKSQTVHGEHCIQCDHAPLYSVYTPGGKVKKYGAKLKSIRQN